MEDSSSSAAAAAAPRVNPYAQRRTPVTVDHPVADTAAAAPPKLPPHYDDDDDDEDAMINQDTDEEDLLEPPPGSDEAEPAAASDGAAPPSAHVVATSGTRNPSPAVFRDAMDTDVEASKQASVSSVRELQKKEDINSFERCVCTLSFCEPSLHTYCALVA